MKKRIAFVLLILIVIPFISAVDITLKKSSYQPRETLQAEITGNFISLSKDNLQIFRENIPREEPPHSDLTKQGNTYYFYAVLPNTEGNFTLKIVGAKYSESGEIKSDDIIKSFTINKLNKTSLSIDPGFVLTSDDFSIKIISLYGNSQVLAKLDATKETKNLSIIEDDEKSLTFSVKNIASGKTNLKINDFDIPVFIIKKSNQTDFPVPTDSDILLNPAELDGTLLAGNDYFFKVSVENIGDKNLTDLRFFSTFNLTINPTSIPYLRPGQTTFINITIPVSANKKGNLSGKIFLDLSDKNVSLPIFFVITEKEKDLDINRTSITSSLSCSSIGLICNSNEDCIGKTTASLEGPCCIGDCKQQTQSSSGTWIAVILVIVLVAILGFFIWKKRKGGLKSPEEILKEKSEKYNKILQAQKQTPVVLDKTKPKLPSDKEVSGKVGRVDI